MRLRNDTRETIPNVPLKGEARDGQPPTDSIAPGETKTLSVDADSPWLKALIDTGALARVEEGRKAGPTGAPPPKE